MKKYESEHYIFNYEEDTYLKENIDMIVSYQEHCFAYITSVLDMKPDFKIRYFLYASNKSVGKAYCEHYGKEYQEGFTINGFADEPKGEIHAVFNEEIKCWGPHEDTHVISMQGECSEYGAIFEGLAMYFDRMWWGISNLEWTAYLWDTGKFVSIEILMNNEKFYELHDIYRYPVVGAFTEWLISTYGKEKYVEFFKHKDSFTAMKEVYHKSVREISDEFEDYVCLFFCMDSVLYDRMKELLKGIKL